MLSVKLWKKPKHLFILLRQEASSWKFNAFKVCFSYATSWLFDLLWEVFETETAVIQPAAFWSSSPGGFLLAKMSFEELFCKLFQKRSFLVKQAWRYSLLQTHPTSLDKLLVVSSANRLKTLKQSITEPQNFNYVCPWCFLMASKSFKSRVPTGTKNGWQEYKIMFLSSDIKKYLIQQCVWLMLLLNR